jgi:hypothetical protein
MKKLIFKPPVYEDLIRLLSAWRVWVGGAFLGALVASILYFVLPPAYRAQATVMVDQHVEQVIPEEQTDLRKYSYLQRETDKLKVIAWSDQVLTRVGAQTGLSLSDLRDGRLELSQPSDGGWHFLANARDAQTASDLAAAWAGAFVEAVQLKPAGTSPYLEVGLSQATALPVARSVSAGAYIFWGAIAGVALLAFGLLFFDWKAA